MLNLNNATDLFPRVSYQLSSSSWSPGKFIPFPKKFEIREKWLKALKLTENDLKASSRVCSFHFFGGERKKNDVPSLEIGEKFGAKSGRKNPKDKMRQYEKNQVKQDGKKINNTSQKTCYEIL